MKEVNIISKVVGRDGASKNISPGAMKVPSVDLSGYLPIKDWNEVFSVRTDANGVPYLFGKLPFVTQYGITMYADGGEVDLPSLYSGIPIDGDTIYWENGILKAKESEVISLEGYATEEWVNARIGSIINGAPAAYDTLKEIADVLQGNINSIGDIINVLGTKWTQDDIKIGNWDTAYKWGDHSKVGYALKSYVDDTFVTIATKQTITGEKNFTGGLKVNGSPIVYDATNKYWKLEGDLLVTGGVTMYASDSAFTPSTIMDGVVVDGVTIGKRASDGALYFMGETGGGLTEVYWDDVKGRPTLLSFFVCDLTIGKMTNVGSWADEAATEDRLLYQATGSTTWGYKKISDLMLEGGGGAFLPLAGGTLNGHLKLSGVTSNYNTSPSQILFYDAQGYQRTAISATINNGLVIKPASNNASNRIVFGVNDGISYIQSGRFGIGTTNPQRMFVVSNYGASGVEINPAADYEIISYNRSMATYEPLRIFGSTIGVKTTSPEYNVHINDTCGFTPNTADVLIFKRIGTFTSPEYKLMLDSGGLYFRNDVGAPLRIASGSADVHIGYNKEYPATLNVHGAINCTNNVLHFLDASETTVVGWVGKGSSGNNHIGIYAESGNIVMYSQAVQCLSLIGSNLLCFGGITMYSDIRKKTKLKDVELSLKQIADAPLIEHYYNSDEKRTTHVGSIAQYWASMNDWFCKLDSEGYYTMEIQNAALASAISIARELVKYESKTDKEIRLLKDEVKRLKKEIKILKSA